MADENGGHSVKATKRKQYEEDDIDGEVLPVDRKKKATEESIKEIVSRSKDRTQMMLGEAMKKKPIRMNFGSQKSKDQEPPNIVRADAKVRSVFNDEDSEEEEMPPEAKMRMRNLGRDTPTSSGPNSFGKGKLGFLDRRKVYEREMVANQQRAGDNKM